MGMWTSSFSVKTGSVPKNGWICGIRRKRLGFANLLEFDGPVVDFAKVGRSPNFRLSVSETVEFAIEALKERKQRRRSP